MARVLITGSRGMLGCALVPHLTACGHQVVCHAGSQSADIVGDLSDTEQAGRLLAEVAPDVIVNLAALTNVDECEQKPQRSYLANVRIVENLTAWIRGKANRTWLVQISTDQVYDGAGPHKESNIALTNYYGFSKYAAELAAAKVPSIVLRTNFFGPSRCAERASLSDWLIRSLKSESPITAFDDIYFSPLSMRTLTASIAAVVENRIPGIYNLGSKDGMNKAQFALALAEVMGLSTRNVTVAPSDCAKLIAYRPKDMRMDSSHFESAFGVVLPTLQEEIRSMRSAYDQEAR